MLLPATRPSGPDSSERLIAPPPRYEWVQRAKGLARRHGSAFVAAFWIIAALSATIGPLYRHENNFEIFRAAWWHLIARQDLYAPSSQYFDLLKYTPTFAVLIAPFALLPFGFGLLCWNLLNAGAIYWAIGRAVSPKQAVVARVIVLPEMIGSLQSAQCNALIAALIIFTYVTIAQQRSLRAATLVMVATFVKIFPLAACSFALLVRDGRRFAAGCTVVAIILFILPMGVSSPVWILSQYHDWLAVQYVDAGDPGFSVMQLVHLALGVHWPAWPQQLVGALILVAPLVARRRRSPDERWSVRYVTSLLMFCVLFNHQSESPSFVIALAGIGLWFAISPRTPSRWILLTVVFVGTVVVSSSLLPTHFRLELAALHVKTVPVLLVWLVVQYELWSDLRRGVGLAASDERELRVA